MHEYVKLEYVKSRRYGKEYQSEVLHAVGPDEMATACGIRFDDLFEHNFQRPWFVTVEPEGHKICISESCVKKYEAQKKIFLR